MSGLDVVTLRGYGRAIELNSRVPNQGVIVALEVVEADDALRDHADMNALLGAAGNTEQNDGSYARKTGLTFTLNEDTTNNRGELTVPNQTWTSQAGDAWVKLVFGIQDGAGDANLVVITAHDFDITPNTGDITADLSGNSPAQTFYRAAGV
jgi:hypothetical protein